MPDKFWACYGCQIKWPPSQLKQAWIQLDLAFFCPNCVKWIKANPGKEVKAGQLRGQSIQQPARHV